MQNAQNSQLGEIARTKDEIIEYFRQKLDEKIIEETNFKLIEKLIKNPQISIQEAQAIQSMATTWTSRTGLVFDVRLEKDSDICYLAKDDKLSFTNDPAHLTHTLIIGDNYPALLNLLITYREKVKMIYIDPPYSKDSMGGYAQTNYQNALTRDNLLSMLKPRLYLAKSLLRDDGVIFCSIDDRNQAYVKCLFDEVFGEGNFVLTCVVNKPSEIATANTIQQHEYILVYSKNNVDFNVDSISKFTISRGTVGNKDQTMPIITFPKGLKCKNIKDGTYKETRKIQDSVENVENFDDIIVENGILKQDVRLKARWRSSNDMRNFFNNNCNPTQAKINGTIVEIYFENDRFIPQIKKSTFQKIPSLFLNNKKGSKDLESLNLEFSFPKSIELIKHLLKISTANNADSRERERERFYA